MSIALLSIGTELTRGEATDANAPWFAAELTQLGFTVHTLECVADERDALASALRRLGEDHSMIFVTGGLGPTSDDVTAEVVAEVVGAPLHCNEDALAAIRRRVEERQIPLGPGHEKQARLPEGSTALPNGCGTAPGFVTRIGRSTAYFLPGVPAEARHMFSEHVVPRISAVATKDSYQIILRTYGLGESPLDEQLAGLETQHPDVTLTHRVDRPVVDVKILARSHNYAEARQRAEAVALDARDRLGDAVFGEGDDTLAMVAGRAVRSRGWRLGVAESCTGGLIASQLTELPASDYFAGGAVTYANSAKSRLLGVSEDTLRGHGAVSGEVAAEMAEGARRAFDCEVAIAVTGIAGPSGASSEKPLGLCYWSVAHPEGTKVEHQVFPGDRAQVQKQASCAALDLLRRALER